MSATRESSFFSAGARDFAVPHGHPLTITVECGCWMRWDVTAIGIADGVSVSWRFPKSAFVCEECGDVGQILNPAQSQQKKP